jgi:hypothetical protein
MGWLGSMDSVEEPVMRQGRWTRRRRALLGAAFVIAALSSIALPTRSDESGKKPAAGGAAAASESPAAVTLRGQLVCLAEEMQRLHGAAVPPVHDHLLGLKLDEAPKPGEPRYYDILRTTFSKALFEDPRYRGRTLIISARRFPATAILEVTRFRWLRDGKEQEVFYWCEVCTIKTFDPGPCACCQGEVEFREREAKD